MWKYCIAVDALGIREYINIKHKGLNIAGFLIVYLINFNYSRYTCNLFSYFIFCSYINNAKITSINGNVEVIKKIICLSM